MGTKGDDRTKVSRNEPELVITRTFDAPAHIVFKAWTTPELFKQWWAPKSFGMKLVSVEQDVRVGGGYRVVFDRGEGQTMAFFGTYKEVVPNTRLVWTNEESPEGPVTTVTFEGKGETTQLVLREVYPTKAGFDGSEGMEDGMSEQFSQLDQLLATLR